MESLKLTYFPSKGRAEAIRLALTVGNIEFEDERISRDEFQKRRSMLPLHSLPALEIDREIFCMSGFKKSGGGFYHVLYIVFRRRE